LRWTSRSALFSPQAAPVSPPTSSSISRSATKPIISRSRSASGAFFTRLRSVIISSVIVGSPIRLAFANPTITEDPAMTTASPPACQRVNPRRQPATLMSSYTITGDTILPTPQVPRPRMS
jgi:hypothetical protein